MGLTLNVLISSRGMLYTADWLQSFGVEGRRTKGAITGDRRSAGRTWRWTITATACEGPTAGVDRTKRTLSPRLEHFVMVQILKCAATRRSLYFLPFGMVFDQRVVCTRLIFHLIFFLFLGASPNQIDQRIIGYGGPRCAQFPTSGSLGHCVETLGPAHHNWHGINHRTHMRTGHTVTWRINF